MLAYYETVRCGLVPVKVIKIDSDEHGRFRIEAQVTADRANGTYKRGDIVSGGAHKMVPREAVRKFRGSYFPKILPYTWAGRSL